MLTDASEMLRLDAASECDASRSTPDIHDLDLDRGVAAIALDRQGDPLSDPDALELLSEIRQLLDRLAVHADDHVTEPAGARVGPAQAGALGGQSLARF